VEAHSYAEEDEEVHVGDPEEVLEEGLGVALVVDQSEEADEEAHLGGKMLDLHVDSELLEGHGHLNRIYYR
jgi:hypothetical protein